VNVCEDVWYPTGPITPQALAGAELIVTINGSPYHAGKARFRERMVATRAADDVVWLAFVNMVGGQDELVFDGASVIVDPHGETVARGRQFVEEMVTADIDLDAVFRARMQDSRRRKETLDAARAPLITMPPLPARAEVPVVPPQLGQPLAPVDEVFQALVLGTRDYVRKNGFKRVVIGLRTSRASRCRHRSRPAARVTTRDGSRRTSASSSCGCRSRRCSRASSRRSPSRSRA